MHVWAISMCSLCAMSDWEEDEDSANVLPLSAYFPGEVNKK